MEKQIRNEMAHLIADIFKLEEEIYNKKKELKKKAFEYYGEGKQKEVELYDKVIVVRDLESAERDTDNDYIGQSGVITSVDEDYDYPYMIKFDNPELNDGWLWKREEINFKQGEW